MRSALRLSTGAVFGLAALLAASNAHAQYFGQNKVQYQAFDYQVLKTEHFDIYFYPKEEEAARQAGKIAERWRARFNRIFVHNLSGRQPLILYANPTDFQQTNAISGAIGEGTGGVTEAVKRRIVLPLGASLAETNHVIGHELVHAYQFDMTSSVGQQGGVPGAERLPLWFIEGMAEYLSLGPVDPNTAMWMRDAVRRDKLPSLRDLSNTSKYFPYRWGQALWAYIAGRWGDRSISDLLIAASATGDVNGSLVKLLGIKPEALAKDWHAALKKAYLPLEKQTTPASTYKLVVGSKGLGQDYNVSPALSPDGRQLVFLSSRGLFSIDLYLANVATGNVERHLVKTAVNPHFSSLEFIYSSGSWSPDGKSFVLSAVSGGQPELVFLDMGRQSIRREVKFKQLGEILTPTWSPDGRLVAFSASEGGQTDLYIYDTASGKLDRVTNDLYADMQPSWSPDGSQIVFVTDRFTTKLTDLTIGNYRLALFDRKTRDIRELPGFDDAKNIDPQWSPNGNIYFLSDRNGISNVYQLDVSTGVLRQETNVFTGVSGITELSPALALAAKSGRLSFSAFEDGKFQIYTASQDQLLNGALVAEPEFTQAAVLPPQKQANNTQLAREMANRNAGLASAKQEKVTPYHSHLSLDYIGQPYLTTGIDPYGTFAGGGVAFFWSDMLGNHSLATAVQVNSGFGGGLSSIARNSGGIVAYQDLSHRWNWGVAAQQVPFLIGGFQNFTSGTNGGTPVGVQQTTLLQETDRSGSGIVSYPFNLAQRVEFSAGFMNVGFSQQVETTTIALDTGQVLSDNVSETTSAPSLNLFQASGALVYDTAIFGATSPIKGQRYRLQWTPNFGTIDYSNVLADYRRYFMPVNLYTIAGRILHYGRWGANSDDPRLFPLYIGYPNLVRGYDINSFSAAECGNNPNGACPVFDRLLGTRMLVGNVEFRFPLLRPFGLKEGVYGPLPVEVAFFGDGGVAWFKGERPSFLGGDRTPVASAGMAFRVNAFGFAILEFDAAHPFNRPGKGWVFQFNISPGF
jgi:hypothetical protein